MFQRDIKMVILENIIVQIDDLLQYLMKAIDSIQVI